LAVNLLTVRQKGDALDQALKLRLARSYAVLELIDSRRAQTGNQGIGWAIETRILDHELQCLEAAERVGEPAVPMKAQHLEG
jgi:hypothetical protein